MSVTLVGKICVCLEEVGVHLELEQEKSGSPRARRPQRLEMLRFCYMFSDVLLEELRSMLERY